MNISEWIAVVAAVALGEQPGDGRRDRADAGLERRAVGDEAAGVLGDRAVDVGRRRVVEARTARASLSTRRRSRRRGARADARAEPRRCAGSVARASTTSSRSGSAPARCSSSTLAPACSERLHQPSASGGAAAVAITRGCWRLEQRLEAAEVGGREADVGARVAQHALDRAEEPGEVVDVRDA